MCPYIIGMVLGQLVLSSLGDQMIRLLRLAIIMVPCIATSQADRVHAMSTR